MGAMVYVLTYMISEWINSDGLIQPTGLI